MYQRYWGGNMDEGWTRWMLEQFDYPYTTVMDKDILEGDLSEKYDVLILPNDNTTMITGEGAEEWWKERRSEQPMYPPKYKSGIGEEGVEAVKEFVEEGGLLLCFGEACNFAIEKLDLSVKNVVKDFEDKDFFCPGSTLHAIFDNSNPLAYGMPKNGLLFLWNGAGRNNCPVFESLPSPHSEDYEKIVELPERDILQSGWFIGEDKISGMTAMASIKTGNGKAVLIGFRPQHRAQTHGTFKLVFNTLIQ